MKRIIATTLGLLMMAGVIFAEPAMGAGKASGMEPQRQSRNHNWRKKRAKRMRHKMKHNKKHHRNERKHNRHDGHN